MKIRIAQQSIRIRIKPAELEALHATGSLHQSLAMGPKPEQVLTFRVLRDAATALITVTYAANEVLLNVSPALITEMLETERVGVTIKHEIQPGRLLSICFEKDFKCLTHRDEDSDGYPHPATDKA